MHKKKIKRLSFGVIATLAVLAVIWPARLYAGEGAPPVLGAIDGIARRDGKYYVYGWTCQSRQDKSLKVQAFVDGSAYDKPPGKHVLSGAANLPSSPELNAHCNAGADSRHNFVMPLPEDILRQAGGRPMYVHGIRVINGTTNTALDHSGLVLFPVPPLQGSYNREEQHPRVFVTQAELKDIANRSNKSGSFSQQMFMKLIKKVQGDLNTHRAWDTAYAGTDINTYLHTFSFESLSGYADEVKGETQLDSELELPANARPPLGAAIVASRMALYVALVQDGVALPPDAPSVSEAAGVAKQILLTWANKGFRDQSGRYLNSPSQFSDNAGFSKEASAGVGLQVSRGMIYSIYAQDILQGLGLLNQNEVTQLNEFHDALAALVRTALLNGESVNTITGLQCNDFGNHHANDLASLLAEARLVGDEKKFYAVLEGGDETFRVNLAWDLFFNKNIYGEHDTPRACYKNGGLFYQVTTVSSGEIDDRFRAEPPQAIGYPMFSLERLLDAAQVLKNAGFDPYSYRGVLNQSIETAAQYYSCFAKGAGFEKTVTAENAGSCPDYQQYVGKTATGAPQMVRGAYDFPNNAALGSIDVMAKEWMVAKGSGLAGLDAVAYGHWRD